MKKENKNSLNAALPFWLAILMGAGLGLTLAGITGSDAFASARAIGKIGLLLGFMLWLFVAYTVHTVAHEAGHLVFGLISGYSLSSFRIFSVIFVKEDGGIRVRRLKVAGTAGQCLMCPPPLSEDGAIPFFLYNIGGCAANALLALLSLSAYLFLPAPPLCDAYLLSFAILGAFFALLNGIPIRTDAMDNDGANIRSLSRSKSAVRALWVQLSVNDQNSRGTRLRDMPEEWFTLPESTDPETPLEAAVKLFYANRLMDMHKLFEAENVLSDLLEKKTLPGLTATLAALDRVYIALLTDGDLGALLVFEDEKQKSIIRQMGGFPSVIRTQYTVSLLSDRDEKKAAEYLEKFEKCARTYPYPADIDSERELMALAKDKYETL